MNKQEFKNIYELVWSMSRIARGICDMRGCVSGDLMIDALSVNRMSEADNIRYWYVAKNYTTIDVMDFEIYNSNAWVIRYHADSENKYSIEKIR